MIRSSFTGWIESEIMLNEMKVISQCVFAVGQIKMFTPITSNIYYHREMKVILLFTLNNNGVKKFILSADE